MSLIKHRQDADSPVSLNGKTFYLKTPNLYENVV